MALVSFSGFNLFGRLLELQDRLDRLLQNPTFGLNVGLGSPGVFPALNIFSEEGGLAVRAEIPGIAPDKIEVSVEPRRLTISGTRGPAERGKGSYQRRERRHGEFSRSLQLPEDLDPDKATADCRNGLLTVRIPKSAAAKPRQISVKSA